MWVRCITKTEDLAALGEHWPALTPRVPFLGHAWLETWWKHYGPQGRGRELFVLCVYDDCGQLAGVAPWYLEKSPVSGRVARFLGSGEVCADYLTLPCRPGCESSVVDALVPWLHRAATGAGGFDRPPVSARWDLLDLSGMEACDPTLQRLAAAFAQVGVEVHTQSAPRCWRLHLPESWDDYLALLSKSHRRRTRKMQRELLDTGEARLRLVRDEADLAQGFQILTRLHNERWRRSGQIGRFACEPFTAFHREVARRALAEGQLRLSWLEFQGRPVAAEYWLESDGVVYAYQSGRDPESEEIEPGSMAFIASAQAMLAEGLRTIDFLRGDEPYKAHWRAQPRSCVRLRIVANRPSSRLRARIWTMARDTRDWLRGDDAPSNQPPLPMAGAAN